MKRGKGAKQHLSDEEIQLLKEVQALNLYGSNNP